MPKYEASEYRCNVCGDFFHTKKARDACESEHEVEQ